MDNEGFISNFHHNQSKPAPPTRYSYIPTSEYKSLLDAARSFDRISKWLMANLPQDIGEDGLDHAEATEELVLRLLEELQWTRAALGDFESTVSMQNLQVAEQVMRNNAIKMQANTKSQLGTFAAEDFRRTKEKIHQSIAI